MTAPVALGDKPIEKANQSFEAALDKVKPTANAVISKLRDLIEQPDEISVEFGIKLSAESGIGRICKGSRGYIEFIDIRVSDHYFCLS